MSYDIYLTKGKKVVQVKEHEEGGTYVLGGSSDAHLNITWNYAWFYYRFFDRKEGIRWLYEKKAKDTIKRLEKSVKFLCTDHPYERDYWAPTPGNAGKALSILLEWAKQHPEAIWEGD